MPAKCYLCQSKEINNIEYGEVMQLKNISVHYFCLLLSYTMEQKGCDNEGILGFLYNDILTTKKVIKSLKCMYCNKVSANIRCDFKMNRKGSKKHFFHLVCGVKNNCLFQFEDRFPSYCGCHAKRLRDIKTPRTHNKTEICTICRDTMNEYNPIQSILAPCCKNGFFHRQCIMQFATTAGYFFKCPLCNDNKVFREKIVKLGVFIPNKDAAWECDSNAFNELLESPKHCNICEQVRFGRKNKPLVVKICCDTCGAYSAHISCWKESNLKNTCPICLELEEARTETTTSDNTVTIQNDFDTSQQSHYGLRSSTGRRFPNASRLHIQNNNKTNRIINNIIQNIAPSITEPKNIPNETKLPESENDAKLNHTDQNLKENEASHIANEITRIFTETLESDFYSFEDVQQENCSQSLVETIIPDEVSTIFSTNIFVNMNEIASNNVDCDDPINKKLNFVDTSLIENNDNASHNSSYQSTSKISDTDVKIYASYKSSEGNNQSKYTPEKTIFEFTVEIKPSPKNFEIASNKIGLTGCSDSNEFSKNEDKIIVFLNNNSNEPEYLLYSKCPSPIVILSDDDKDFSSDDDEKDPKNEKSSDTDNANRPNSNHTNEYQNESSLLSNFILSDDEEDDTMEIFSQISNDMSDDEPLVDLEIEERASVEEVIILNDSIDVDNDNGDYNKNKCYNDYSDNDDIVSISSRSSRGSSVIEIDFGASPKDGVSARRRLPYNYKLIENPFYIHYLNSKK